MPGPPVRFAILCLGRTGSTHLQSQLDFHSQATCLGEVFGDGKPPTFASSGETDPAAYVERLLGDGGVQAVGLKLPLSSIRAHPGAGAAVAADRSIRVIRLSRRNRLAQLVSRRLLAETGVSQSIFGDYGEATVRIEPAACLRAFERIEEEEAELDRLAEGHPSFRLDYEELISGERAEELQRFLDLDPEELRSWYTRLRTRRLSETVSNWEELAAALREAGHAELLDD